MPDVTLNYLAILAGAVANMVLGALWYGPLFGKQWMALTGMTGEKLAAAKAKGMTKEYALGFVGALAMSYVLAHVVDYTGATTATLGAQAGFWSWLGFIAPVMMSVVLWEGKPWKLWGLNSGYYLISLVIMGAILATWQ